MGWLGDIVLANLTPNAFHTVTPRIYRLRLLNGSNARIYRLAFVKGDMALNFTVIGTDGGLIERPETVAEAFLAPGERLDVLFDAGQAQAGDEIFLKNLAFDPMENKGSGGMAGMGGMGQMMGEMGNMGSSRLPLGMAFNVLKLSVVAGDRVVAQLPASLSQIAPIRTEGAPERKIELSMEHMRFLINGRTFRMDEIAFDVNRAHCHRFHPRFPRQPDLPFPLPQPGARRWWNDGQLQGAGVKSALFHSAYFFVHKHCD